MSPDPDEDEEYQEFLEDEGLAPARGRPAWVRAGILLALLAAFALSGLLWLLFSE